jgi:carbonic anhydrase
MKSFEKLLQQNKKWSAEKRRQEPGFFEKLSKAQTPEFLWIGCSDSRVPAEIVVNAEPGEIFIHRNIANQVIHTDFNCLSVLQYAINVLKVKHVIVCGHYNCGGIQAALKKQSSNSVITNKWLMHIKNSYRLHQAELDAIQGDSQRVNRLVELNVLEQVNSLSHTSIVQKAWRDGQGPILHGWVYGLHDGLLNPLIKISPDNALIDPIFQYGEPEF